MILLGCQNNSAEQLLNLLQFKTPAHANVETESIFKSYRELLNNIPGKGGRDQVNLLNRVLVRKGTQILPEFKTKLESQFDAQIDDLDSTPYTAINEWVSKSTNDKIKNLLDSPPDPLTSLILLNAIYFKGVWERPFSAENTDEGDFKVDIKANNIKKVKYMHMPKSKFNYTHLANGDKTYQVLELPYSGSNSMIIVLTDPGTAIEELIVSTPDFLTSVLDEFDSKKRRREIIVTLPKFKVEQQVSLTKTLGDLGAGDLISPEKADLSGIDGSKNLYVSDVRHKAAIEVNEEGSEAAAASSVSISMRSFSITPAFKVDHPFLFVIRDRASKIISFVGKVSDPQY